MVPPDVTDILPSWILDRAACVALLLRRNFGVVDLNWLQFFVISIYATSIAGVACTALAAAYFQRRQVSAKGAGA